MKEKEEDENLEIMNLEPLPAIPNNLSGLRQALFDEINLLRAGKTTTSKARSTSLLAKRIVETVLLELHVSGDDTLTKKIKKINGTT